MPTYHWGVPAVKSAQSTKQSKNALQGHDHQYGVPITGAVFGWLCYTGYWDEFTLGVIRGMKTVLSLPGIFLYLFLKFLVRFVRWIKCQEWYGYVEKLDVTRVTAQFYRTIVDENLAKSRSRHTSLPELKVNESVGKLWLVWVGEWSLEP